MARYPQAPSGDVRAKMYPDGFAQMGGPPGESPWQPIAIFPTAPLVKTRGQIGYVSRYYFATPIVNAAANADVNRIVRFNYPVRIAAIYGAGIQITESGGNYTFALPGATGSSTSTFKVQFQDDISDFINTESSIGTSVCGTAEKPGQLGGPGWSINAGGAVQMVVTPLAANLRIHIGFLCLEARSGTNFVRSPG